MDARKKTRFDADPGSGDNDDGFTLIELMVVVLVIAILLAIAVPTFLGARERSQDRAAQSSLRNALTAAKVLFVDNGDYRSANHTNMQAVEPSLVFTANDSASADEDTVSVLQDNGAKDFHAAALSESGTCWRLSDESDATDGGTKYGSTTGTCDADAAAAASLTLDGWRND